MISPIPLGGYVKLLGENKEEEIEDSLKKFSFQNKSAFQKILIVAGGPLFNFIFAALVFGILFIKGVPILQPYVGEVQKNFPAQKAGIKQKPEWKDLLIKAVQNK